MQFVCSTCGMSELRPEGAMKTTYAFAPIERLPGMTNTCASFDVNFNQLGYMKK